MSREEFIQKFFPSKNKDRPGLRIGGFSTPVIISDVEISKQNDFAQLKELTLVRYKNAYECLLIAWQTTIEELEKAELTQ